MDTVTIIVIASMLVLLLFGGVILLTQKKEQKMSKEKLQQMKDAKRLKQYDWCNGFFLTNDITQKIVIRLQELAIYTPTQIKCEAVGLVKVYFKTLLILLTLSIVVFHSDTLSLIASIIASFVVANRKIDMKFDRCRKRIFDQLRTTISNVREEYLKSNFVPDSILEAEKGELVKKLFDDIYNILVSKDSEILLQEYFEKVPFRCMQTFATICYSINNTGDSRDEKGVSNFVNALNILTEDIISELDRIDYLDIAFGNKSVISQEYLALLPFVASPVLETFLPSVMPGTTVIFNSPIGIIMKLACMIIGIVCYIIIGKMNSIIPIKLDDREINDNKLLENKFIKHLVDTFKYKNARLDKWNLKAKEVLSSLSIEEFFVRKIKYSFIFFVVSLCVIALGTNIGRTFIYNNTQELSIVASDDMEGIDKEKILELDSYYIEVRENGNDFDEEELHDLIKGYMPKLSDMQLMDQMERLKKKYDSYENAYFHFWFFLIAVGLGVLGWYVPELSFKFRNSLIENEKESELMQLQTLMTIIMNLGYDTLQAIEDLHKGSTVYKDIFMYCYHEFPNAPNKSIERAMSKTNDSALQRFLKKLQTTISDVTLKEAYGDLEMERDYLTRIKDRALKDAIDKKKNACSTLIKIPIYASIICMMIYPLGILGVGELMKAFESMNTL